MKKIFRIFIVTLLLFISCNIISADVPSVSINDYVYDQANLLTDSQIEELNNRLKQLSKKHNLDVRIHTTNDTYGLDTQDYADDYYDYNNFRNDGLVLVLDMQHRIMYISTKGKGIDYFTDYGIDYIFDEIESDIGNGRYYEAFDKYIKECEYFIEHGEKGDIIDIDNKPKKFGVGNLSISAILAAITSGISSFIFKGQMKSISKEKYAINYVVNNSFKVTGSSDMFVNKTVSRRPKPSRDSDSSSRGSSGGSTIHTSSSGSTHGGHGRSF